MKIKIAFFFTLLFSVLLITPTVISLVDDSQDVAFLLDINEEEENKGKEVSKDLEIKIHPTENLDVSLLDEIQKTKNVSFCSKEYTSEYPKNTTPPPEFLS